MIESVITSSALILVMIGVRILFRGRVSRRLQYALWGLVLLRLLMPFSLLQSPVSIMNAVRLTPIERAEGYLPAPNSMGATTPKEIVIGEGTAMGEGEKFAVDPPYQTSVPMNGVIKRIWIAGAVLVGLWFIITNGIFYNKLRKNRRPYAVEKGGLPVYIADFIPSPCLFGPIFPAIYLTPKAAASEMTADHVLAHELCHYRHGDHIFTILRGLCLALYWFNPLVWAAAALSCADSELACDEATIKRIGEENRLAYGRTLVGMIGVKNPPALMCAATTMTCGMGGIKKRLNMIVKNPKTFIPSLIAVLLIVAVGVGCTFTGAKADKMQTLNAKVEAGLSDPDPLVRQAWTMMQRDIKTHEYVSNEVFLYSGTTFTDAEITKLELAESFDDLEEGAVIKVYLLEYRLLPKDPSKIMLAGGMTIEEGWLLERSSMGRPYLVTKSIKGEETYLGTVFPDGEGHGIRSVTEELLNAQNLQNQLSYSLLRLSRGGRVVSALSPLEGDNKKLAEEVIYNYMLRSAAWPGVDITTLSECYLIRRTHTDGTSTDYYAFMQDGYPSVQIGTDGHYSRIDPALFTALSQLAKGIDPTDLEANITDAILTKNARQYQKGDFRCESHVILKTVEDKNTTTVYMMALYLEFGYSAGGASEIGGSHIPVAVTFTKNEAGQYTLAEYWTPGDGAYYGSSIKEKFPADIFNKAINTQAYIAAQKQECYEKAAKYGGSLEDIEAKIGELIDAITASPATASNPGAYIDAHQNEYDELLRYGDYTLGYVFAEFLKGGQTGLRGHIMVVAMRDLLGEEDVEFSYSVGQEWFDQWRDKAVQTRRANSDDYMQKYAPKAYRLLSMMEGAKNS